MVIFPSKATLLFFEIAYSYGVSPTQGNFPSASPAFYETIARHETLHNMFPPRSQSTPTLRLATLMQEVIILTGKALKVYLPGAYDRVKGSHMGRTNLPETPASAKQ